MKLADVIHVTADDDFLMLDDTFPIAIVYRVPEDIDPTFLPLVKKLLVNHWHSEYLRSVDSTVPVAGLVRGVLTQRALNHAGFPPKTNLGALSISGDARTTAEQFGMNYLKVFPSSSHPGIGNEFDTSEGINSGRNLVIWNANTWRFSDKWFRNSGFRDNANLGFLIRNGVIFESMP